jgi:hypothetical protein
VGSLIPEVEGMDIVGARVGCPLVPDVRVSYLGSLVQA